MIALCCLVSGAAYRQIPEEVTLPVLLYHEINEDGAGGSSIAYDNFLTHLDAVKQAGYQTVTIQQVVDYVDGGAALPDKPVLITFDDGYMSNYELAWPALEQRGMKGTIFVIGWSVGKDTYKDTGAAIIPHFSYEQAREMMDSGVMDIQSHTYDMHQWRPLEENGREGVLPLGEESTQEYEQALAADLVLAREELTQGTGQEPQALAYPFGLYTRQSEAAAAEAGFRVSFTTRMQASVLRRGDRESLRLLGRYSIDDCPAQRVLALLAGEES